MRVFNAYIEWDPDSNMYIGLIPGISGAHTQAASLDELRVNLKEVLELCLEENGEPPENLPRFVGIQQIEIAV